MTTTNESTRYLVAVDADYGSIEKDLGACIIGEKHKSLEDIRGLAVDWLDSKIDCEEYFRNDTLLEDETDPRGEFEGFDVEIDSEKKDTYRLVGWFSDHGKWYYDNPVLVITTEKPDCEIFDFENKLDDD